jgi:hypothetical protein
MDSASPQQAPYRKVFGGTLCFVRARGSRSDGIHWRRHRESAAGHSDSVIGDRDGVPSARSFSAVRGVGELSQGGNIGFSGRARSLQGRLDHRPTFPNRPMIAVTCPNCGCQFSDIPKRCVDCHRPFVRESLVNRWFESTFAFTLLVIVFAMAAAGRLADASRRMSRWPRRGPHLEDPWAMGTLSHSRAMSGGLDAHSGTHASRTPTSQQGPAGDSSGRGAPRRPEADLFGRAKPIELYDTPMDRRVAFSRWEPGRIDAAFADHRDDDRQGRTRESGVDGTAQ